MKIETIGLKAFKRAQSIFRTEFYCHDFLFEFYVVENADQSKGDICRLQT